MNTVYIVSQLIANDVGSKELRGELGRAKRVDILFGVPENKITVLILVLLGRWRWSLALRAEGALEVVRNRTDGGEVLIEAINKLVMVVAGREWLRQFESFIVQCTELELRRREAS